MKKREYKYNIGDTVWVEYKNSNVVMFVGPVKIKELIEVSAYSYRIEFPIKVIFPRIIKESEVKYKIL